MNNKIKKGLFFVGAGGKIVYNSWKEVIINLLIDIVLAIIFGCLIVILAFLER